MKVIWKIPGNEGKVVESCEEQAILSRYVQDHSRPV